MILNIGVGHIVRSAKKGADAAGRGGGRPAARQKPLDSDSSVMCAGAILDAGMARVVFGIPDLSGGAVGSLYQVGADPRLGREFVTTHNVRAPECAALLTTYLAARD